MSRAACAILAALLAGCSPSTTISVPAKACKATYTGQTKDASYIVMQCYARDKDGLCTMEVPQTYPATAREVLVQCGYLEWRTE